jgi:pSer/pThr/pTyr-binding forkhead associated (FHA) protein
LCLIVDNRSLILMEGANVIGRAPDATISVEARGVWRHHARILVSQGEATLEDLGSKNGTLQNGTRVTTPVRLSDGDEIRVGATTLTFRVAVPASPTETIATENTCRGGRPDQTLVKHVKGGTEE